MNHVQKQRVSRIRESLAVVFEAIRRLSTERGLTESDIERLHNARSAVMRATRCLDQPASKERGRGE